MPTLELDPNEVTVLMRGLAPRRELIYRLAIRGLCERCRGDREFRERTEELTAKFKAELQAILAEAAKLGDDLLASVASR
jgi:DNA-binding MarR family transcriptional regulator